MWGVILTGWISMSTSTLTRIHKPGHGPCSAFNSQCCGWGHIHTDLSFILLTKNSPWHMLLQNHLGYLLQKNQTGQRHSKDPAQRKISLSLVLFISVTASLEATAIEILDAFVSPQSHAFLTSFLDQTVSFLHGPKILTSLLFVLLSNIYLKTKGH